MPIKLEHLFHDLCRLHIARVIQLQLLDSRWSRVGLPIQIKGVNFIFFACAKANSGQTTYINTCRVNKLAFLLCPA